MNRFQIASILFASACGMLPAQIAEAATISSLDGRWTAEIREYGGWAGECEALYDNQASNVLDNIGDLRHFVRIGTNVIHSAIPTAQMGNTFERVSFIHSAHNYTAVLRATGFNGVIAIVHGEMISGSTGGLRVSMTFVDTTPSSGLFTETVVKPFVYADVDVHEIQNNSCLWQSDRFRLMSTNPWIGTRDFVGRNVTSYESRLAPELMSALDAGIFDLTNTNGPSGDVTTALGFAAASINAQPYTIAYAIGGANMSIPAGFGLPPSAGSVGIHDQYNDWGAMIKTGLSHPDGGNAGEIDSVSDLNAPLAQATFLNDSAYFVAIDQESGTAGQPMEDTFRRITFLYPTDAPTLFSTVLQSKQYPGVIAIIDGVMHSFEDGGLIVRMQFVDVAGVGRVITPIVYADLNVDNMTSNTGEFSVDQFTQSGTGATPTTRCFRAATFDQYASFTQFTMWGWLSNGHTNLNSSVLAGPADIAAAFRMHPWRLRQAEPYVFGFAIGNPSIDFPWWLQPSVDHTCVADVAPAPGGDGVINVSDLLAVIQAWGACTGECAADITPNYVGDGLVNVSDLLAVISAWGDCFPK